MRTQPKPTHLYSRLILEEHLKTQAAVLGVSDISRDGPGKTADIDQMLALGKALRKNSAEIENRLSRVLSEAQMDEYRQIRAEQPERFQERMLSGHVDAISTRLELSPEQTEQARPVLMRHTRAHMAILDKYGIEPGQRGDGDRPGFRTLRKLRGELDANNTKTKEQLCAVLSEQQPAAYGALQAEQKARARSRLSRE